MDSKIVETKETTVEKHTTVEPTVVEKKTVRETVEPERKPETITITHTES